jgi:hypothetical protein
MSKLSLAAAALFALLKLQKLPLSRRAQSWASRLSVVVVFLPGLLWYYRYLGMMRHFDELPGPGKHHWLLGNFYDFVWGPDLYDTGSKDMVGVLLRLHREHRKDGLFRLWHMNRFFPFARRVVVVHDPVLAQELLGDDNFARLEKGRSYDAVSSALLGDGVGVLSQPDGPAWRLHRQLVQGGFSDHVLDTAVQRTIECIHGMSARWDLRPGVALDINAEMSTLVMDVISRVTFSQELPCTCGFSAPTPGDSLPVPRASLSVPPAGCTCDFSPAALAAAFRVSVDTLGPSVHGAQYLPDSLARALRPWTRLATARGRKGQQAVGKLDEGACCCGTAACCAA